MKFSILLAAASAAAALGAAGTHLKGTVEYSFEEGYRILRTDSFVYLIKTSALDGQTKQELERTNSVVSLTLPPGAIVRAWPAIIGGVESEVPDREASLGPDSVGAAGEKLILTGKAMPSVMDEFRFVQVGAAIFRLRSDALSESDRVKIDSSSGRMSVAVPKDAIESAWSIPASTGEENNGPKPDYGHFRVHGNRVELLGTVLTSFDEAKVLIQADGAFFQVRKDKLKKEGLTRELSPGSRVQLTIDGSNVSFIWTQGHTVLPSALLKMMRDK